MEVLPSSNSDLYIMLLWPATPGLVVIAHQWWRRPNGQVQAWYNDEEELSLCVALMEAQSAAARVRVAESETI